MFWLVLAVVLGVLLASLAGFVLLTGFACGGVSLYFGRRGGPQVLVLSTVLATMASVGIWVGIGDALDVEVAGIAAGIVAGFFSTGISIVGGREIRPQAEYERFMAAYVPAAGQRLFDSLDPDKDGIVTTPDLRHALKAIPADSCDALSIYLLSQHAGEIGHALDLDTRKKLIKQEGRRWYQNAEDLSVGISREDLATYKQQVLEKYKNWL